MAKMRSSVPLPALQGSLYTKCFLQTCGGEAGMDFHMDGSDGLCVNFQRSAESQLYPVAL